MKSGKKISVIIPAYNAESKIEDKLKRLRKMKWIDEVIVVDDGSTDDTAFASMKYAHKVISLKPNHGKGAAMRVGADNARGDIIVFIDSKQYHAEDVEKLVDAFIKNKAGMVLAARDFDSMPWERRLSNTLTKFVVYLVTGRILKDPLTGFRVIKRKDFLNLNTEENRFAIESEINFRALQRGFKVVEVPVETWFKRTSDIRGFKNNFNESRYVIGSALRIKLGKFE